MRIRWGLMLAPLGLVLLALVPLAAGVGVPPLHGTVTTCASTVSCSFSFNTTAGTGWASTSGTLISFQLPGEAKASDNLSYATYTASLTGTYTYWTVGNFLGTDVNSGHVVYGNTNTNFTITCVGHSGRGGGCTYTYTTDNGTIAVHFTSAYQTSAVVSCTPATVPVGKSANCTATVTNLWNGSVVPTGKVHLSAGGLGSFSNKGVCTLSSGQCSLTFRPFDNTLGSVTISVSFSGSATFYKSTGSTLVSVTGGG